MGCTNAKAIAVKKTELVIPSTGFANIDEMFRDLAEPMAQLSKVKNKIKDAEIQLKTQTFLYLLIDCNLTDAITVILYSLSASLHNDFSRLKLSFVDAPPYIVLDKHILVLEVIEPLDSLEILIKCYADTYTEVLDISERLMAVSNELENKTNTIKKICIDSDMNIVNTAKVFRTVKESSYAVEGALRFTGVIKKHIEDMKIILEGLNKSFNKEVIERIIELGKKIAYDKDSGLRNIILKYWPERERVNLNYGGVNKAENGFCGALI